MHTLSMSASLFAFCLMMSLDFGALNPALGIASAFLLVVISTSMDMVDHESQIASWLSTCSAPRRCCFSRCWGS